MDASFNVTMQPFRALVGDMVSEEQRNKGYSIQSFSHKYWGCSRITPTIYTYLVWCF